LRQEASGPYSLGSGVRIIMKAGNRQVSEYISGDVVEPGEYVDIETGAKVFIHERDELPSGHKEIEYRRRFRKVDSFTSSRIGEEGV
jgi:hypothetical protein